ncbi:MAG: Rpn family recombination-promoting nuclease/putative transposase, partial [Planctomycetota bacterium]|nr:Rpn family recombination-promoting nuclease/putative transposase [Planctomycetota bacterium]
MGTPHDSLFHFTFRHPRHAGPWLRSCLHPALGALLDWSTLTLVSGKVHGLGLRIGVTDIVYEIRFHSLPLRLFFVVEHRSHHDAGL